VKSEPVVVSEVLRLRTPRSEEDEMSRAARTLGEPWGDLPGAVAGDDAVRIVDVPLTVAAVAARLGVAPSTLRTWDRRYGLGPSGRSAGSHRRYTPEDVARLETMRRLTLAGAAPSDAARVAAPGVPLATLAAPPERTVPVLVDDLTLAAAAVEGAETRLRGLLAAAVGARGLVEMWDDVARPAFRYLDSRGSGDRPGRDPVAVLAAAVLGAVREVAESRPVTGAPRAAGGSDAARRPRAALLADPGRLVDRVAAHVLAGALAERGVEARVVTTATVDPDAVLRLLDQAAASAICLVGAVRAGDELTRRVSEEGGRSVVLVGSESPEIWLPRVSRVRTLGGALHEAADLLAEAAATGGVAQGADART
jgi:transposase-like protein